jgi:uncharacterized membrane protein
MSTAAPYITEPMTMATDYVLTVLALIFAVSLLLKAGSRGEKPVYLWVWAFSVAAVAALAGGTAHGFKLYLGEANHALIWGFTVVSIGLTVFFLLVAGIYSALRPTTTRPEHRKVGHRWLKWGLTISLAGVLIQMSGWSLHEHFNHNDIYHVVQTFGLYCFYRSAMFLHDLID